MRWTTLLATALLFGVDGPDALACQCMNPGPPCQDYFVSDVVFVGTVREIAQVADAAFDDRVRVVFEQVVPSRGVQGNTVTVFTSADGASCGYPFKQGERYVVYGSRRTGEALIRTSICSRTRLLKEADEDLRFFGTLSRPATSARVFGSGAHVERDLITGEAHNQGPAAGIALTLRGDGRSFEVRTAPDGRYEINNVPPGTYELTAAPPERFAISGLIRKIELKEAGACRAEDFIIRYDTRVSGTIVHSDGRPVANAIVTLMPSALVGKRWMREPETTTTDQTGRFELREIPAGRYIAAVNVAHGPDSDVVSPTRFHPNATDAAEALAFDVEAGEHFELARMVIPPSPPSFRVAGIVTFQDGTAARGVQVSLTDPGLRWQFAEEVTTGKDGAFSFPVQEGISYRVDAWYAEPENPGRAHSLGYVQFVASEEKMKSLVVILSPVRR